MAAVDEREEELSTLNAIYPELLIDPNDPFSADLQLLVTPAKPVLVRFIPTRFARAAAKQPYSQVATNGAAYIERDVEITHLPPLNLRLSLPPGYPSNSPPNVRLTAQHNWLPKEKLRELEEEVVSLWEEYGRCEILFAYIDSLHQLSERGFDLDQSAEGCLVLPDSVEIELLTFNSVTKQTIFNAGTYDCGICLEPKKGISCHKLQKCGHVFCRQCLQDFYNNAISEGDVSNVKCLSPDCGKHEASSPRKRKRRSERTLQPRELLDMGVEENMVRRYVEMKRKKTLEADKTTVYCPRSWCQAPAKSTKYPPIPKDLSAFITAESSSDEDSNGAENDLQSPPKPSNDNNVPPNPTDRLAICEKCSLAFCKVCYMGWHGPFARCFPRDPSELSAEEKASYDYIRLNTSPCPYCNSPTQKTMGCNHMKCFTCNTHFCYLCSAWLDGNNPYQHYNKGGSGCYQRLWELEEGDEGQAPRDGRGFAGGRGWEQMAIEAAREAEAQEAAAAAQAEEDERTARAAGIDNLHVDGVEVPIEALLAQIQLEAHPAARGVERALPGRRRARNPFPAQRLDPGAANAVRAHERNRGVGNNQAAQGGGAVPRRPPLNDEQQQQELQRFLQMAERDEEDGWDSDELGDEDEGFVIR